MSWFSRSKLAPQRGWAACPGRRCEANAAGGRPAAVGTAERLRASMQGVNISARRRARESRAPVQSLSGDGWLTFSVVNPPRLILAFFPILSIDQWANRPDLTATTWRWPPIALWGWASRRLPIVLALEVQAPSGPSRGVGRTGFTGIWKQPADPAQNQPVAGREWQPA
jgi:hypothetical protein